MTATRLEPHVFKVPLDKIRAGYYSDKYFLRVSEILRRERHNPRVTYQFFARDPATVVGIDESLAILRTCTGYYDEEEKAGELYQELRTVQYYLHKLSLEGSEVELIELHNQRTKLRAQLNRLWVDCWPTLRVRALYDGDTVEPWEPFLVIEGPQQYFASLETVLLGVIARPTGVATATREVVKAAGKRLIMFFPARFDHYWVQATDGYAALKAGAFGVSTDANADYWGAQGLGTIPHALIASYRGSTAEASLAFDRQIPSSVNRIILVDWDNDCIGTTLRCARAFQAAYCPGEPSSDLSCVVGEGKNKIFAVRFDTSSQLRDISVEPQDESSLGVCPQLVFKARRIFDEHGLQHLKIVASGGFTAARIDLFERLKVPVDMYGVGSSLMRKRIDITADVVEVNSELCAKVGRQKGDYSRLATVQ